MKKTKTNGPKPTPRTNIRWANRAEYKRAKAAAGTIPLSTHVRSVYLRSIDDKSAA